LKKLLFFFILLFGVSLFHKELLELYAKIFHLDNATKGADALIVLGGNSKTRPLYAVKLYNDGYAKEIFITSPKQYKSELMGLLKSERDEYLDLFRASALHVKTLPSLKDGATSTFDEAYDTLKYVNDHNLTHIIIVTDDFHSSRAHYAFEKVFTLNNRSDVTIEVAAVPSEHYDSSNWYTTEIGLSSYISEFFKYMLYLLNASNLKGVEER
jgi:uncharacterized SAM-binding protein YcdF (DUF218 family)